MESPLKSKFFSISKQELLDPNDCLMSEDPSFTSVDSQAGSSTVSTNMNVIKPAQSPVLAGASSSPRQPNKEWTTPNAETPGGEELTCKDEDLLCGWGAFKPKCLQVFNTAGWVLFFQCVTGFLRGGMNTGFVNAALSTIEKRFALSSYESGLIICSFQIGSCLSLVFVSYFGSEHKPRWVGSGVLIMAVGCLLFSLPHFAAPAYEVSHVKQNRLCSATNSSGASNEKVGRGGAISNFRFVFMLSKFILGVGSSSLATLGVTYIDENINSDDSSLYLGIFYSTIVVGCTLGFIIGGQLLSIYTEISQKTVLTPDSPLWVGAWWIGFPAGGIALALAAIPIFAYPRQLPGSQELKSPGASVVHQSPDRRHKAAFVPHNDKSLRDLSRSIWLLLRNPTYVFICLCAICEGGLGHAFVTFFPKFLESQVSVSASTVGELFGATTLAPTAIGTFLGGYIVKRLKLQCRGILRFCIIVSTIGLLLHCILFLHCPNVQVAGVMMPYKSSLTGEQMDQNNRSLLFNLTAQCNADCGCDREDYYPVCGADGLMYSSPCFAGCSADNLTESPGGQKVYSGCSCVTANLSRGEEGFAYMGKCSVDCKLLPLYLVFIFLSSFMATLISTPLITATLRCVPDSQKSLALGFQFLVAEVFGVIPGPIIFGSLIDKSCILWQNQHSMSGSCYVYQNADLSKNVVIASVISKAFSTLFLVVAARLYKNPTESSQIPTDPAKSDISVLPVKDLN